MPAANTKTKSKAKSTPRCKQVPIRVRQPSMLKMYKCTHCCQDFNDRGNLKRHIQTVHEKRRAFSCEKCGKGFTTNQNLRTHIQTIHLRRTPYNCSICYQTFTQLSGLNRHLEKIHKARKSTRTEQCTTCRKLFTKAGLGIHAARMHNNSLV